MEPNKVIRMDSLLPSNNASHPMDAATRRNRLRRAILETLERRELMAADIHAVVLLPTQRPNFAAHGSPKLGTSAVAIRRKLGWKLGWYPATSTPPRFAGPIQLVVPVQTWAIRPQSAGSIVPDGTLELGAIT